MPGLLWCPVRILTLQNCGGGAEVGEAFDHTNCSAVVK